MPGAIESCNSAAALDQLALIHRATGDYQSSLQVYLELGRRFGLDGYHKQLALSRILAGEPADEPISDFLRDRPEDGFFWFEVASCLAVTGRFEEADRIFARDIELKLPNGGIANTSAVRFLSLGDGAGISNIPFLRARQVRYDPDGPTGLADVDVIHFVACDASYLKRFLEPAIRSLQLNCGLRCGAHVHIIDADEDALRVVEDLRRTCAIPIALSTETVDPGLVPRAALKTYFSIARFLVLPDILAIYRKTTLVTDVDQLVVRSLSGLIKHAEAHDVALLHFAVSVTNVMALFSASAFVVCCTEEGLRFVAKIRDYLLERIDSLNGKLPWHLDQVALSYAKLTSPNVRWYPIPGEVLQSDIESREDENPVREKTLFWSVTASFSNNRQKEGQANFREFVLENERHNIVRPKVLIADIDLHSVAGGGQVLFRNLMANNPGIDFFYFSRGPDLRLKEGGQLPANVTPLALVEEHAVEAFYVGKSPSGLRQFYERLPLQIAASCADHDFDAVDVPSYLPTAGLLRHAFELFRVRTNRIVLSLHGWISVGVRNAYEAAAMEPTLQEFLKLENDAVGAADALYTVSEHHRAEAYERFGRPVTVIDMHHVLDSPTCGASHGALAAKPDLWFVGRLDRNKGPDLFLGIVARLPRHLFGDCFVAGPDLPMLDGVRTCADILQERAGRAGVALHYKNVLSPAELRERAFNGKTVVIVPSRSDTFNLAALEAVTSGTPLLLSEEAGAASFLAAAHPGVPVLTMQPDNLDAAARKLTEFLIDYPQSAHRFQESVRAMRWPLLARNFMRPVYCPEYLKREKRELPKIPTPYVKLQPDPRTRTAERSWDPSDPLLTIIIPTYRRPQWLVNCLTALAQERPARTRVLVIDDGSPPDMQIPAIVARYGAFARVVTTENRGEANAVNLGIASAETPYVMILSDDDVIEGAWPERALSELEKSGAVLAYPNWAIFDVDGKVLEEHHLVDCTLDRLIGDHWCLPGPGSIFRRDHAIAIGGRNGAIRFVSDYDFWLRLSARGSFKHVPVMGAYWRYHEANGTFARERRLADEHVEIIAADIRRRKEAGPALTKAMEHRALATAHLAAGVILSRGPGAMRRHFHFLRGFLLSPRVTACLPGNIFTYSYFYPRWLQQALQISRATVRTARRLATTAVGPQPITAWLRGAVTTNVVSPDASAEATLQPSAEGMAPPSPASQPESAPPVLESVPTEQLAAEFAKRIGDTAGNPFHSIFDQAGYHLVRKHFYVPLPELADVKPGAWTAPSRLAGVDMNERAAHELMDVILPPFLAEFRARYPIHAEPGKDGFHLINGSYMAVDAHVLYGLARHFKPRRIIEIGNGASTMIAAAAAKLNRAEGHAIEVISIDPYPSPLFASGFPGLDSLIAKPVQDVPLTLFESLGRNDILFIDSSHVLRWSNDVYHLYLNILPILNDGVFVHVHDISLPMPYPKVYFDNQLYWNEQYLLQAFLMFNKRFKVTWPGNYMMLNHPAKMLTVFPEIADMRKVYPSSEPTAFWMQVSNG